MNRKWLYTSVTRATELKNVFFFNPKDSSHDFDEEILDKYLAEKVENYKKQDHNHGRVITDNYITPDWLKAQFGKVCHDSVIASVLILKMDVLKVICRPTESTLQRVTILITS